MRAPGVGGARDAETDRVAEVGEATEQDQVADLGPGGRDLDRGTRAEGDAQDPGRDVSRPVGQREERVERPSGVRAQIAADPQPGEVREEGAEHQVPRVGEDPTEAVEARIGGSEVVQAGNDEHGAPGPAIDRAIDPRAHRGLDGDLFSGGGRRPGLVRPGAEPATEPGDPSAELELSREPHRWRMARRAVRREGLRAVSKPSLERKGRAGGPVRGAC